MEVKEAVTQRKSIRAFSPELVPTRILCEIMEMALRTPSWGNTQPWKFTIVGGNTLNQIKEEFVELVQRGAPPRPDIPVPTTWNEIQTFRYKELGKSLFQTLRIGREDQEKRNAYYLEMTRHFGAPHVIYLHFEKGFNSYSLLDGGMILQTIALLAVDRGLGTCFLARSILYPDVVRKHAGISSNQILIMGTAIGYLLLDHPAIFFRSQRGKPEEFIKWVDHEQDMMA